MSLKKQIACTSSEKANCATACSDCSVYPERLLEGIEVMPIELNLRIGGAECPQSFEAVTGLNLPWVAAEVSLANERQDVEHIAASLYQAVRPGVHLSEGFLEDVRSKKLSASTPKSDYHSFVCSKNFYAEKPGLLKELRFKDDFRTLSPKLKLLNSVLYQCSVGRVIEVNNGSQGCLGWIATGGDTEVEAQKNLTTASKKLVVVVE